MDSIPLEMDDIFEDYEDAEDFYPARLPDLADELDPLRNEGEEAEGGDDLQENPEILSKLKSMKGASKNVPKRSMPKLNAERLLGDRGIPALPQMFKKVPLLGRNHEAEDLKLIMRHLEHWGHRLFPKMPFAEVLDRVERLGSKKEVQNCVKRIRLDMPVVSLQDEVDEVQRGSQLEEDSNTSLNQLNHSLEIDESELDDLLRDQGKPINIVSRTEPQNQATVLSSPLLGKTSQTQTLSDELKAKIERNKMLALSKRVAKLKEKQSTLDVDQSKGIDDCNNLTVLQKSIETEDELLENYVPETTATSKDKSQVESEKPLKAKDFNSSHFYDDEESNSDALFIAEDE
ncbi:TIMELESS-interacting protein [Biomphalaria glabrata]|uniref:TIMELESS-interacting protein n=1 Tax=Biomphalaria glabrata TaxID=6526 RepID=A0A9W3BFL1_BIOGL|nr:TIMELESS-interacting protein-like [Biomphalaria glabrata]KAI8769541.1 TIMELESS-interacting protein-like [Biomphalaria glabrata]KAI8789883.1 TIMELESS-interacting protein [Biomphalaria glabrata]